MARKLKSIFIMIMAGILVLGFQNCGESSLNNDQSVFNTDLSQMLLNDGETDSEISLYSYDKNTNEDSIFSIKRLNKDLVRVSENDITYLCNIKNENPFDLFIETVNSIRISHPSRVKNSLPACSNLDLPTQYLIIKSESNTSYVVFKNYTDIECLSSNPEMLMRSGKRTFIAEEISSEEINEIVFSGQEMLDVLSCTEEGRNDSMSALIK